MVFWMKYKNVLYYIVFFYRFGILVINIYVYIVDMNRVYIVWEWLKIELFSGN